MTLPIAAGQQAGGGFGAIFRGALSSGIAKQAGKAVAKQSKNVGKVFKRQPKRKAILGPGQHTALVPYSRSAALKSTVRYKTKSFRRGSGKRWRSAKKGTKKHWTKAKDKYLNKQFAKKAGKAVAKQGLAQAINAGMGLGVAYAIHSARGGPKLSNADIKTSLAEAGNNALYNATRPKGAPYRPTGITRAVRGDSVRSRLSQGAKEVYRNLLQRKARGQKIRRVTRNLKSNRAFGSGYKRKKGRKKGRKKKKTKRKKKRRRRRRSSAQVARSRHQALRKIFAM